MTDCEHEHDWGDARTAPIGTARPCRVGDCTKWGVRHRRKVRWEEPTVEELIGLTAHMMEAVAIAQAMQIIHGSERGLARAREALGYDR